KEMSLTNPDDMASRAIPDAPTPATSMERRSLLNESSTSRRAKARGLVSLGRNERRAGASHALWDTRIRAYVPAREQATFQKGKAAGWGPGGSRTSAIVSGGWECDRRR